MRCVHLRSLAVYCPSLTVLDFVAYGEKHDALEGGVELSPANVHGSGLGVVEYL